MSSPNLVIPHPRIAERAFVLAPLCDVAPHLSGLVAASPSGGSAGSATALELLSRLIKSPSPNPNRNPNPNPNPRHPLVLLNDDEIHKVALVGPGPRLWRWSDRTFVMGIVNVTPDSFSDGGKFHGLPLDDAVAAMKVGCRCVLSAAMSAGRDVCALVSASWLVGCTC